MLTTDCMTVWCVPTYIAEVCTYLLLLCTVTAVYWGERSDNELFQFFSSVHVHMSYGTCHKKLYEIRGNSARIPRGIRKASVQLSAE